MKRLKILLVLLAVFASTSFFQHPILAEQALFSNNLFTATPYTVSVTFNTPFTINVTNLQNDSLWLFCLAQENITRVDAPTFYTLQANETYHETYQYKFISPNMTDINSTYTGYGYGNNTAVYEIYFGAVNAQATSFQTTTILLQMTTVESLNAQLQQLLYQNAQLEAQVLSLIDKASSNNALIIASVLPWVLFPCVILYMRLGARKKSTVALTPHAEVTS